MKIEINNLTKEKVGLGFLEKVAIRTAKLVKLKISDLSVALVDEKKIKALNKKHLNKNRVTDVLAFDYGEIVICLAQAKKQAQELGHSLKDELSILLIHGILHLAGYNDENKKDFNQMAKKQKELWGKLTT